MPAEPANSRPHPCPLPLGQGPTFIVSIAVIEQHVGVVQAWHIDAANQHICGQAMLSGTVGLTPASPPSAAPNAGHKSKLQGLPRRLSADKMLGLAHPLHSSPLTCSAGGGAGKLDIAHSCDRVVGIYGEQAHPQAVHIAACSKK